MPFFALTGQDTVQIAGRQLRDFGDGNVAELTYPNPIVGVKTGKNGNTVFNVNASGQQAKLKLRLLRGSPDDVFLQTLLAQQLADLPSFPVMPGYFVKRIGDGTGNVSFDTQILAGGVFDKQVEASENVEGATDPALSMYELTFANGKRANM